MRRTRGGYTLFELILVMAVLVMTASLSLPAIEAMLSSPRVTAGLDMTRARLADIRGRAMKEGRAYKFSFMNNSPNFRIEPEDGTAGDADQPPLVFEGELPEKLFFCKGQSDLMGLASPSSAGTYEVLAIFLSDGTAREDATIYIGNAGEEAQGLHVRALLGTVTSFNPQQGGQP